RRIESAEDGVERQRAENGQRADRQHVFGLEAGKISRRVSRCGHGSDRDKGKEQNTAGGTGCSASKHERSRSCQSLAGKHQPVAIRTGKAWRQRCNWPAKTDLFVGKTKAPRGGLSPSRTGS